MDFLLPALRRGLRAATKPLRFVRRQLRQQNANTELTPQQRSALLAELGQRQAQLANDLRQVRQQNWQTHHDQLEKLRLLSHLPPLERLRLLYPWPTQRPPLPPSDRGWDGGGRDIVTRRLTQRRVKVILEIGAFLGLSTRKWLSAVPDATVICVDPWYDHYDDDSGFRHWPDVVGRNIYQLFLSSCWDFRDRIIPVRGTSPSALQIVADLGAQPDLIYIDGDHAYESAMIDIETSHRFFPNAILTGDDWTWDKHTHPPRAVREAVEDFAASKGWRVDARDNTWALDR
jgi:hypothetical protein